MTSRSDPVSQVAKALLINDSIGHAEIFVDGSDGAITLKGVVESEQDKLFAGALAQEQAGELQVINKLKVFKL